MFLEAVIIASNRAGPDVGLGSYVGITKIGQVRNLSPFADCGFLRFHEVAHARAALQVRPSAQAGEWADCDIVLQPALRDERMRFDGYIIAEDCVTEHAAGANRASLADFSFAEKLHCRLEHGVFSGSY